jgi:hypothetical protein
MHYLPILVASIASFIVGGIWYGPLFGKPWRKMMGIPEGAMAMPGVQRSFAHTMALRFLVTIVITFVLSGLLTLFGVVSVSSALMLAFVLWLGFTATTMTSQVLFENKPLALYFINIGNELAGLLVAALVLAYWHW